MGKRLPTLAVVEEQDFPEIANIGSSFEFPTSDEFVCTGDEVREECAMLGGEYDGLFD
jgi:hypothetical protein